MRLFIGIPFSEETRNRIRKEVVKIHPLIAKGKFSNWEGYHLTLKFLGEVPEPKASALTAMMEGYRFETERFELRFTGLGAFRKSGGDVLWLGVSQPPELLALQQEVERLAASAEFEPDERAYAPHLTLARGVRYAESFEETVRHWSLNDLKDRVDMVALFHSTQVDGKLAYVQLLVKDLSVEAT